MRELRHAGCHVIERVPKRTLDTRSTLDLPISVKGSCGDGTFMEGGVVDKSLLAKRRHAAHSASDISTGAVSRVSGEKLDLQHLPKSP